MLKQPTLDEVSIAHRLFKRGNDRRAAIRRCEDWPPFVRRSNHDQPCNSVACRFRIARIVDVLLWQGDRLGKSGPKFLLNGAAGDELPVLRRINPIARRTANEPHLSWLRKSSGCRAERQSRPGES